MADILLSFGVATGSGDVSKIQDGLNEIIKKIEQNPPKVRVGLTVDDDAIRHFKKQLQSVLDTVSLTNGTPITIKMGELGDVSSKAKDAKAALDGAADAAKRLNKETSTSRNDSKLDVLSKGSKKYSKALEKINGLLVKARQNQEQFTKAKYGKSSEEYARYADIIRDAEKLMSAVMAGGYRTDKFDDDFEKLKLGLSSITTNIKEADENTRSFGGRLKSLAEKFGSWLTISQAIMMGVRAAKQMTESVIEIDTAMTELKKVTDETSKTYTQFLETATMRARTLGATLSDVVTASADFAKLGYNIDNASALADAAIVYKNVGDGISDINEASQSIIATMQAYGIEASNAMLIVDKFNTTGNEFAITSKGVGDALLRSAASMHAANNTLDETIALITAANTIVQNPETVGTTLKTVSMYLRAAKTEAEEAGESADGMAGSVSELRQEILALTGHKVDIQLDDNNFKSTYQILQELSAVWGDLTDTSRANILELVGGKRNANVVSALLENFTVAEESLKASANAAGSALEENEKYLESIKGKISQFKIAFEDLSNTLLDSWLVKFFVDLGTTVIDTFGRITQNMKALGTAAAVLAITLNRKLGIYGVGKDGSFQFNLKSKEYTPPDKVKEFFESFEQNDVAVENMTEHFKYFAKGDEEIGRLVDSMDDFAKSTKYSEKTLENFSLYMQKQNGALKTLGKSFKNFAKAIAIDIAIASTVRALSGLFALLSNIGKSKMDVFENFDDLSAQLSDAESELNSLETSLSTVESQIDELLQKDKLSFADEEELGRLKRVSEELKVQIDLTEKLKESLQKSLSAAAVSAYSEYAMNTSFSSSQSKEERKQENKALGSEIGNAAGLVIGGIIGTVISGGNPVVGMAIGSTAGSLIGNLGGGLLSDSAYGSEKTVAETLDNMRYERERLKRELNEAHAALSSDATEENREAYDKASTALSEYESNLAKCINQLNAYYAAIDYATLETEAQREEYRKIGDYLDSYNVLMGVAEAKTLALSRILGENQMDDDVRNLKEKIQTALNAGLDATSDMFRGEEFSDVKERLWGVGITITEVIEYMKDLHEEEQAVGQYSAGTMLYNISSLSDGIQQLIDAFSEFNSHGMLTAETLMKLSDRFGNLGDAWSNYVDIMTSGSADMTSAADATQGVAKQYLQDLLDQEGIRFTYYDEADKTYKYSIDQYKTYLATINELELLGVENAKQYVDALQQRVMIQRVLDRMSADAAERKSLEDKKRLTQDEQQRLEQLQNQNVKKYIEETEKIYGIKIEDTGIIDQYRAMEETANTAGKVTAYMTRIEEELNAYRSSYDAVENIYAEMSKNQDEWYELWRKYGTSSVERPKGIDVFLGLFDVETDWDRYTELKKIMEDSGEKAREYQASRRTYFDTLLAIAKDMSIDVSDIPIEEFVATALSQEDKQKSDAVYLALYDRVMQALEGADYDELSADMKAKIENALEEMGFDIDLDLNVDEIVFGKLDGFYGALEKAQAEMNKNGGLSVDTIQSLKSVASDYLDYLYEENGLIKLNTDAWKRRADQDFNEAIGVLENEISKLEEKQEILKEDRSAALWQKDIKLAGQYTEKIKENNMALQEKRKMLSVLVAINEDYTNVANKAVVATSQFIDALSSIHALDTGFDMLGKIYADIKDSGSFDWGSIINNDQFINEFGYLGDAYLNFVETITNNTGDIDACQQAFDNLTTAYVVNSSALQGVTDETKNAVAAWLEYKGIANANEIVDRQLAYNKEKLIYTTGKYADATYQTIYMMYSLAQSGTVTKQVLAELAATKMLLDENPVDSSREVQRLIDLATAANATVETIERLNAAMTVVQKLESEQQSAANAGNFASRAWHKAQAALLQLELRNVLSGNLQFNGVDSSLFDAIFAGQEDLSAKQKSWFEEQYERHKHQLAMEQETEADFLAWLEDAYKRAYRDGVIDLSGYYKYQEEVFSGMRDLFKDHLGDIEHEISMREGYDGESDKIIALYTQLIADVEKEISAARESGLDDTSDYIQELQSKWQGYTKSLKEIQDEALESAKNAVDELVDYRIDMIRQDIEDEKDALNEKLDNLKEFYDKQKEMLQDRYDEERYLEDQAEKRRAVDEIEYELAMLKNDDSAWAQKRKLELQDELANAQKELKDFEDEHALEEALDALDQAYDAQEKQIQAEIDALDELLNDPNAIYNQALQEIQENTGNLYNEMLEYNRSHGTGNDEDVADIYEAAYKALLKYLDVYGENYGGVILDNSTGYVPENGAWDSEVVSGTNPSNQGGATSSGAGSVSIGSTESPAVTPSLEPGSAVTIKDSATHYGTKSGSVRMASFVPGSTFTVSKTADGQVLVCDDDGYIGWVNQSDIVGYRSGTPYSVAGLAEFDEDGRGSEYIFESSDGRRYRMFGEGSKVLSANATSFLYDFATSGGSIISKLFSDILKSTGLLNIVKPMQAIELYAGDIVVNGNADRQTVSEIRRAQRETLEFVMKEFKKLNK